MPITFTFTPSRIIINITGKFWESCCYYSHPYYYYFELLSRLQLKMQHNTF